MRDTEIRKTDQSITLLPMLVVFVRIGFESNNVSETP